MLVTPNCHIRRCRHYEGVIQPDGTEETEAPACKAFPDGIPIEIAYGNNKHLKPIKGQGNDIVYEREEELEDKGFSSN